MAPAPPSQTGTDKEPYAQSSFRRARSCQRRSRNPRASWQPRMQQNRQSAGSNGRPYFNSRTKHDGRSFGRAHLLPQRRQLPDTAAIDRNHRSALLASKGGGEAGLVDDHSVHAEVIRRVWISEDLLSNDLRAGVLAVVLCEADIEALGRGVTVNFLIQINPVILRSLKVCDVRKNKPAIVSGVLAERQLAVDLDVIHRGERTIFIHQTVSAGLELLRILSRPPVAEVALAVELTPFVVEAMCEFMANHSADVPVVDCIILLGIVEGRLKDSSREVDVIQA